MHQIINVCWHCGDHTTYCKDRYGKWVVEHAVTLYRVKNDDPSSRAKKFDLYHCSLCVNFRPNKNSTSKKDLGYIPNSGYCEDIGCHRQAPIEYGGKRLCSVHFKEFLGFVAKKELKNEKHTEVVTG